MRIAIIIAAVIAALVAAFMLYVGFQHNPQMEFFDTQTGKIDYRYSFLTFGLWFAVVFLPVAGVACLGSFVRKLSRDDRSG
jgi:TRAP-type C4-dicarboxylate transport system permease small subunit